MDQEKLKFNSCSEMKTTESEKLHHTGVHKSINGINKWKTLCFTFTTSV